MSVEELVKLWKELSMPEWLQKSVNEYVRFVRSGRW